MQVVFVHGVSTRDLRNGEYAKWVEGRNDRLNRLAFEKKAHIQNPYWGQFGLDARVLKCMPTTRAAAEPHVAQRRMRSLATDGLSEQAKQDFSGTVASLSVAAISIATTTLSPDERHRVEDFWVAAAQYADAHPAPLWLSGIGSTNQLIGELRRHIGLEQAPGPAVNDSRTRGERGFTLPSFNASALVAGTARHFAAGYLAQFLGDALMFFSRREQSMLARSEVCRSIVVAARQARETREPLVLIGYSMGGGVLHEVLTDPEAISDIQAELGGSLHVNLFLSIGTQIGLFAELKQFIKPVDGSPLGVPVDNYWNVFDYNDTLSFLCAPVIDGTVDLEVSTGANVAEAHGAYFESALFYSRLKSRLSSAGLI